MQNHTQHDIKQYVIFGAFINGVLMLLLVMQFFYFRSQYSVLIELQEEYQNYIVSLRAMLDGESQEGGVVEDEKKKFL